MFATYVDMFYDNCHRAMNLCKYVTELCLLYAGNRLRT